MLNDLISMYLPEFEKMKVSDGSITHQTVYAQKNITIKDLLKYERRIIWTKETLYKEFEGRDKLAQERRYRRSLRRGRGFEHIPA